MARVGCVPRLFSMDKFMYSNQLNGCKYRGRTLIERFERSRVGMTDSYGGSLTEGDLRELLQLIADCVAPVNVIQKKHAVSQWEYAWRGLR